MANTDFLVPRLEAEGAWLDWRGDYNNGFTGFGERRLDEIRFLAPHHSVTNPTGDARRDVNTLFNIHAGNGWNMIGYNFVVTSEEVNGFAKVAYVGDLATVRAHTPNTKGAMGMAAGLGNRYIAAACMIGQNHLTLPSQAQLRSMKLLMEELLFFENDRLPNLWPQWDDMWPHYTWDWTQCNGKQEIRQMIIDAHVPAIYTPPPAPQWEAMDAPRSLRTRAKTSVIDLDNGSIAGTIEANVDVALVQKKAQDGKLYLRSQWSLDNNKNWGIDMDNLMEIPVTPPPVVEEPKPVVRALGALKLVYVNQGDKVVDVITGEPVRTYEAGHEPYEATHTVEWNGKTYYMTQFGYSQYEKGKNPTGVDKDTVDTSIIVPPAPEEPQIPPHDGDKPPVDEDLKHEHDEILNRLGEQNTLLKRIADMLSDLIARLSNK